MPMRASSTRRGALPLRKPGRLDLAGDRLERPVDVAVELGLVDLDVQLDLVPLEGFERALHRAASATGGVATRPLTVGSVGSGSRRRRAESAERAAIGQNGRRCRSGSRTPSPSRTPISSTCGSATGSATVDDLHGVPAGTEGKVILANGFNWQRYRVLFDNGAELGDLDHRNIEPIGRAAKRLAKAAAKAAR